MKSIFLWCVLIPSITYTIPQSCQWAIEEVAGHFFHTNYNDLDVSILHGGYSHVNTVLLLKLNNKEYVLRVKKEGDLQDLQRELYSMKAAADLNIAPQILYISTNHLAVLMEFVPTGTLSMHQSRKTENIIALGSALRLAHAIPKNPYYAKSGSESVMEAYDAIREIPSIKLLVNQAMQLWHSYDNLLERCPGTKVNIHGDLNPRNILLYNQQVYILDWDYVSLGDPFMDLSYLSMRLDYTRQEEMKFLEYYLEHIPTAQEQAHYYYAKQLNWAELAVYFFYFAIQNKKNGSDWDSVTPIKTWSEYVKDFVDQQEQVTDVSQYFYDTARCLLEKAAEKL